MRRFVWVAWMSGILALPSCASTGRTNTVPEPDPEPGVRAEEKTEASPRELGLAASKGDPEAWAKLERMLIDAHEVFQTSGNRRGFSRARAAFAVIGAKAGGGDEVALNALINAIGNPNLLGHAVQALGIAAGKGNRKALAPLLAPEQHGIPLSSAVAALGPAAANGNQLAIDALADVTANDRHKPLWFLAVSGLRPAAANGNEQAVDALIRIANSDRNGARRVAIAGLKEAASKGNAKAAETLEDIETEPESTPG